MRKFTTRKEQLEVAHKLLKLLSGVNMGGISPTIKQIITDKYLNRIKETE